MSMWLVHLGAKVAEVSNNEISEPSIFLVSEISSVIDDYQLDVRDADAIKVLVEKKSA